MFHRPQQQALGHDQARRMGADVQRVLTLDPDRVLDQESPRISHCLLPGHLVVTGRGAEVVHVGPLGQVVLVGGSGRDQDLDRNRRSQQPGQPPCLPRGSQPGRRDSAKSQRDEPAVGRDRQTGEEQIDQRRPSMNAQPFPLAGDAQRHPLAGDGRGEQGNQGTLSQQNEPDLPSHGDDLSGRNPVVRVSFAGTAIPGGCQQAHGMV